MGFAIGDCSRQTPTLLKPLIRKKITRDIEHIRKILSEYEIQKIIIGYPLNMNGSKSTMVQKIEDFRNILKKKIGIDIEYVDERLTSFEAEEMLKPILPDYRKRKKSIDSTAALIILNNYLGKK